MEDYKNIIRLGIVSAINTGALTARVYYPQLDNLVSGWLNVLQTPRDVNIHYGGLHQHEITINPADGHSHSGTIDDPIGDDTKDGEHKHGATLKYWMPKVNDRVIVAYLRGFNTDGYILVVIV